MSNTTYYDSIAKGYDNLHKEEQMRKIAIIIKSIKKSEEKNDGNEKEECICLDIGCGTGFSLDVLAKETNNSWIGIEPSVGMVKQYKGNQQILIARAESLPFPNNYADLCISITAIQNFDDSAKGVEEMSRVSKDNVPIIITCLKKSSKLGDISAVIADLLLVKEVIEEEKDIIFVCRNKKHVFVEDEE